MQRDGPAAVRLPAVRLPAVRLPAVRLAVVSLLVGAALTLAPVAARAAGPTQRWSQPLPGAQVIWSSPVIADLDGTGSNDVLIGGENGFVYALDAAGHTVPGWPAKALGPVDSSPAVGDLDGNGGHEVVVGSGRPLGNETGGVSIFNANGSLRCNFATQPIPGQSSGVFNAPAIGDVTGDGINDVVFGSFDHHVYVIDGHCNQIASYNNGDTVWSAPALYATDHGPKEDIFIGNDSSAGAPGTFHNGGIYRSLTYQGGTLAERWERSSTEDFQGGSSVGDLEGNGRLAVVTGSGAFWCRSQGQCADSSKVWAFHLDDGSDVPGWPRATSNVTFLSAPSLGDLDGDGRADVVIGSTNYSGGNPVGGAVDAFLSSTGYARETKQFPLEVESSPLIADAGSGSPQVVVSGAILDRSLHQVASVAGDNRNAAAVGRLGGGTAVVAVGHDMVTAYDVSSTSQSWPLFQQNAQRTGSPSTGVVAINCASGYRLVAADGGIFSFFDAFFGSAGAIHLNSPVVGLADRPQGDGYWMVAADGGIFNFGGARLLGSMGGSHLNSPVVGMAATPSGNGYWLVAADGGIFNFGDAPLLGSMGGSHLNSPVVGMAATPSGRGYWLVAADGGIFNFGDAPLLGSMGGRHLNFPVVGMARTPSGTGYWLVAADGGIFNFGAGAGFFGSTGAIHLNKPIVGMVPSHSGQGYWFDASDGGIFNYGDAQFCGSTGSLHLNSPVVGMG